MDFMDLMDLMGFNDGGLMEFIGIEWDFMVV